MSKTDALVLESLQRFAEAVKSKMGLMSHGEPEDQVRGPFENLMTAFGQAFGWEVGCKGETLLPDRLGRPDYAVHRNDLLTGHVELKAPGLGADHRRLKGRDREQFKRFSNLPNILYTDGIEWALYRNGELIGPLVRLAGDIATEGRKAVGADEAVRIARLLNDFLQWQPFIPTDRQGRIDLKGFAAVLAPLCRMLRDDVTDALSNPESPLVEVAKDWRQLLFPDASDTRFADSYAQTVAFALLLGRSEGAEPLTLRSAEAALAAQHSLLAKALGVLTDERVRQAIASSVDLLSRVIAAMPVESLTEGEDPWLYFYEDFLAQYDPDLRKNVGAYYTPVEVVRAQVRLIDDLLVNEMGRQRGFADPGVVTLDPSVGTGTYLLGVISHALSRMRAEMGKGSVAGQAGVLAANLHGFEILVGPYSVAELRVSRALQSAGAKIPEDGTRIYLTDTLESPNAVPASLPYFLKPISDQHAKALKIKSKVPVIVCLGNPPYDRHEADNGGNQARTGGWVRWGDDGATRPILQDYIDPAVASGHGKHVKNLYNLYVYFWRWALWKVFEHNTSEGPGIVSFISASSYLEGDAFAGMREHMRRQCDEVWVLDLGGEGRGTRRTENVFDIQTPVAIAIAFRAGKVKKDKPANVHYLKIEGSRDEKLGALNRITKFKKVKWQKCPTQWQSPFKPAGKGEYFKWPQLTDLMPWQHSGCEIKRTWPVCHDSETLLRRWKALLASKSRALSFRETRDRTVNTACPPFGKAEGELTPIAILARTAPAPRIVRYAFRSLDRQKVFIDNRLGDYYRPQLWKSHGKRQVYIATSLAMEIGKGPALMSCLYIPDRHYFAGRGGKDIVPLYRDSHAADPNLLPGLLDLLGKRYKKKITPEDFLAYVYGLLAQPAFTGRFHTELETRELRVPLTGDAKLFERARAVGARLLWLHTYGERLVPKGQKAGHVPRGKAKCRKGVPGDPEGYPENFRYDEASRVLHVGEGEFSPVSPEMFNFEVSGLKVVHSWLKYRMKKGAGKKSSPLDDIRPERWTAEFTTELLELLWVLEATLEGYSEQQAILEAVIEGPCINAEELPPVPEHRRKPPAEPKSNGNGELFDSLD